jgi:hypothetical protein
MKKKIAAIILVLALSFGLFAGCMTRHEMTDALELLGVALENSRSAEIYFWEDYFRQEVFNESTKRFERQTDYSTGKVLHDKDNRGNILPDTKSVHLRSAKGETTIYEAFCGLSNGNQGHQNFLFETVFDTEQEIYTRNIRKGFETEDFIANMKGSGYTLFEILDEVFTVWENHGKEGFEWIDFENARASTTQNRLSYIHFNIKSGEALNSYLEKYREENGRISIFTNASRVLIEIVAVDIDGVRTPRISNVICYRAETSRILWFDVISEIQFYELFIVYFGPNIRNFIPSYNDERFNNATENNILMFDGMFIKENPLTRG